MDERNRKRQEEEKLEEEEEEGEEKMNQGLALALVFFLLLLPFPKVTFSSFLLSFFLLSCLSLSFHSRVIMQHLPRTKTTQRNACAKRLQHGAV